MFILLSPTNTRSIGSTDEAAAAGSWINELAEITSPVLLKDVEGIPISPNLDEDYEGLVIRVESALILCLKGVLVPPVALQRVVFCKKLRKNFC